MDGRSGRSRCLHFLVGAALVVAACSGGNKDESPRQPAPIRSTVFPDPDWAVGDPAELGFDPEALEGLVAEVDAQTNCILVVRHGQIAGEWYFNGWTEDSTGSVWSVTQPYAGTLVGIAQDEGLLDIDDPVSDYVPAWRGTPSEDVTIRDVLGHTTGLRSSEGVSDTQMLSEFFGSNDPAGYVLGLEQQHSPGTVWAQSPPAIQLLEPVLLAATGQDPVAYAQDKLFAPIGSDHTTLTQNASGHAWMVWNLQSTCRDMARFGHLMLQGGRWADRQVVSQEWVAEATRPSQEHNAGFGFLWWLNQPGSLLSIEDMGSPDDAPNYDETPGNKLFKDAPADMYWGLGLGGQVIQVHPGSDTVVVQLRTPGNDPSPIEAIMRLPRFVTEAL